MFDFDALSSAFSRQTVLCVGDLMLDEFVYGEISRISPEAPAPVIAVQRNEVIIGGAGNVARNIAGLGARCIFVGLVGVDDAGDRLRIVVYGQEGLTNTYAVDAGGSITMPLIGGVRAKGLSPAELARSITARLKQGYIREPYVAVEIEAYRPFFILGEVTAPGQYPYVPNMTAESAVAIAGGFTPRAQRQDVKLTRTYPAGPLTTTVPIATTLKPGDTILVGERWF